MATGSPILLLILPNLQVKNIFSARFQMVRFAQLFGRKHFVGGRVSCPCEFRRRKHSHIKDRNGDGFRVGSLLSSLEDHSTADDRGDASAAEDPAVKRGILRTRARFGGAVRPLAFRIDQRNVGYRTGR